MGRHCGPFPRVSDGEHTAAGLSDGQSNRGAKPERNRQTEPRNISRYQDEVLPYEGGEGLAQVAQRSKW